MNEKHLVHHSKWLPTPGNMLFTLFIGFILLYIVYQEPARGEPDNSQSSTDTISYQGQLTDTTGSPLTGTYNMIFKLYPASSGSTVLWTESWSAGSAVEVTDGLFHVMLGSIIPIPQTVFTDNPNLWLGIQVGADNEMTPRTQLGSVPFARQALTVPDGAITTDNLIDGAVTSQKLALQNESICLTAPVDISIPAEWEVVAIPGMSVSFSLPAESQVLMWTSGGYHFNAPNFHIGTTIFLDNTELVRASEYTPFTAWNDFSLTRLVSLTAGNHILDLRTFAQTPGTVTYGGSGLETCLQFIVLN